MKEMIEIIIEEMERRLQSVLRFNSVKERIDDILYFIRESEEYKELPIDANPDDVLLWILDDCIEIKLDKEKVYKQLLGAIVDKKEEEK